ncbi:hypothetical protein [Georgenia yuyongxinii]|uniref:Uncharacterized protein n=1 Tax=Georgenia yuyongxinii TaxID=2589797 RepID=A0A552WUH9_9MICO|nr:hypothetical protein [Georgenia yuyongxinii]TRW46366.1 hypothetical protein FJ693_05420 [Georgenia yuyongxinii]
MGGDHASDVQPNSGGLGSRIHARFKALGGLEVPRATDPPRSADLGVTPEQVPSMEAAMWERVCDDAGLLTAAEVAALTGVTPSRAVEDAATGHTLAVVVDGHAVVAGEPVR